MSFGKNIVYYRKKQKITQEELAERLFVSRQTISRWENDSILPDVETVIKLCELFGCSMDTLVRGDAESSCEAEPEEILCGEEEQEDTKGSNGRKGRKMSAERINGAISSVTMTIAIFVYLIYGLLMGVWHPTWIIFIVATGICAISSVITGFIDH